MFLDANVLFSAAYRERSGLRRLWELERVQLVTSGYAAAEAHRNLSEGEPRMRLESLPSAPYPVALARNNFVAERITLLSQNATVAREDTGRRRFG